MSLANIKIGTKLVVGFVMVALVSLIIGIVGIVNMSRLNDAADNLYKLEVLGVSYIKEANINLIYIGRDWRRGFLAKDEASRSKYIEATRQDLEKLKSNIAKARPLLVSEQAKEALAKLDSAVAEWEPILQKTLSRLPKESYVTLSPEFAETTASLAHTTDVVDDTLSALSVLKEKLAKQSSVDAAALFESSRSLLITFIVGGLLAGIALGLFISRLITRPLGQAVAAADRLAAGDLSGTIEVNGTDEVGKLLSSMKNMQRVLDGLITDIRAQADAAVQGDFSKRIDMVDKRGFGAQISETLNQLSTVTDSGLNDITRVATAMANGDLSQKITKDYPGVFGTTKTGVNNTVDVLTTLVGELKGMVDAAANRGDFSSRIPVDGKVGYNKELADLLNQLSIVTEAGLNDITRVATAMANGDLSQKITKDYPGVFGTTKTGVNNTVDVLTKLVSELKGMVDAAANRGDFSSRISVDGKVGYNKELGDLLNQLSTVTETGLNDVARVLKAVAKGDLTESITANYVGIFGQLKDDTNSTVERLREVINQIKEASDTINTASQEIASGNLNLSQRTESQAASLEETASSMEELTSTVKQNAENAKQANQLAHGASQIAIKGGEVVDQVVNTMEEINTSAKKIADIISVIDGIAFQTNILALNAAVEAARAGEQGRGFAVVASEVRNLAQRSATAAKEIKTLIGDSVDTVEVGSKLVDEAGRQMEEVVAAVKRVTDIMSEISAASVEQSAGIEQVNTAIIQMDDTTQQNAALVEEAAAAAQSMADQSNELAKAVSAFKCSAHSELVMPAPRLALVSSTDSKSNAKKAPPQRSATIRSGSVKRAVSDGSVVEEWSEF